jgi:hydrogenase maturation protease
MNTAATAQIALLVVGYGNQLRGDDAAGTAVAHAITAWNLPGVRVRTQQQLTPELVEAIHMADSVLFIDASHGTSAQPQLILLAPDDSAAAFPAGHISSPTALLALCTAIYGRAPTAWLLLLPTQSFELGAPLSAVATTGVQSALRLVWGFIAERLPEPQLH